MSTPVENVASALQLAYDLASTEELPRESELVKARSRVSLVMYGSSVISMLGTPSGAVPSIQVLGTLRQLGATTFPHEEWVPAALSFHRHLLDYLEFLSDRD